MPGIAYRVYVKTRGHTWHTEHDNLDVARSMFEKQCSTYKWVLLNKYHDGRFICSINGTVAVSKGEDPDKIAAPIDGTGRDIDHTGFCLGQFNTVKCIDCPTKRECLVMYGKDQVQKVLKMIEEDNK